MLCGALMLLSGRCEVFVSFCLSGSASEAELGPFIQFNCPDTNLMHTPSPVLSTKLKISFVHLVDNGMPAIWSLFKLKKKTPAGWTAHQWMVIPEQGSSRSALFSRLSNRAGIYDWKGYSQAVKAYQLSFSFLPFPGGLNGGVFLTCLLCLLVAYVYTGSF